MALTILSFVFLHDGSQRKSEKIDYPGVLLLTSGVLLLILGLSEGQYWGWYSLSIITTFAVSALAMVLFVIVEARTEMPFVSLKLLRIRNVFLSNFTGLFAIAGMFFLFYSIPALLQDPEPYGFGLDIVSAGLTMLPVALVSMALAPVSAKVTKKLGPKVSIMIGTVLLFGSFLALYYSRSTTMAVLEDVTVLGAGMSFVFVGTINILLVSSPREEAGAATGVNVVFRNIGTALAAAIAGVLETANSVTISYPGGYSRSYPTSTGFNYVYLVGMVVLAVSVIFTLLMKNVVFARKMESPHGVETFPDSGGK